MNWEMVSLSNISKGGIMVDGDWIESKDQDPNGSIRLLQLADVGDGIFINKSKRFVNPETAKRLRCTFLEEGDILIARMPDPIGRACVFPLKESNKYITVVDVCILRVPKSVNNRYVSFAINSPGFRKSIDSLITGTTRQRISRKNLGELKIPLPPLHIQEQIADTLDKADALRRKDQELLQKYDELAQAIFYDMFGDPVKNTSTKSISLSEICEVNPKKSEIELNDSTLVSFVPMEDVSEDGEINVSRLRKFSEVKTGFTYFKEGDVLFAKITPCMENGKGCIAKGLSNRVGFGSTEFHVLRPITHFPAEFIHVLLSLKSVRKIAEKNMTGSAGQKRVPKSFFDRLQIANSDEQGPIRFSKMFNIIRFQKQLVKKKVDKSEKLFMGLMSKFFN